MNKLFCMVAAGSLLISGAALAGKAPSPGQSQPAGSVVTTTTVAAAISNASNQSVTVTGVAPNGGVQVQVSATSSAGSAVSVPAVAAISAGVVTVTFSDGSSLTFNVADFS